MKNLKKFLKPATLAMLFIAATISTGYALDGVNTNAANALAGKIYPVFVIIRNLAFIGLAFVILGKAWGYIEKGEFDWKKEKAWIISVIVGFVLLFGVQVLITAFLPDADTVLSAWK